MFIDSHCHINFPELADDLDGVMAEMAANRVTHALCVSVNLESLPDVLQVAQRFQHVFASVGVHPNEETGQEPEVADLVRLASHSKVVAIGETGLDYFRLSGSPAGQQERFRRHIEAAKMVGKPLIVHTRDAAADTLAIMDKAGAAEAGGVMHCFTESLDVAEAAIAMGFYISFSGIVTFKNAFALKEVARRVPMERMLIETDSPYLAPVPYRGKTNRPAYVRWVAEEIARLRNVSIDLIGEETSKNFFRLFGAPLSA
jgi:TatD DNase family protein